MPDDSSGPIDEHPAERNPYVDGRAAVHRASDESEPLFGEAVTPGEFDEAGLITGGREDPVLVAGVGYPLLGDLALGTVVAYRVAGWDLEGVAVADCSHTPVAAYQTITAGDHRTVLLVGAEKRGEGALNDGTPSADPGGVHEYGPDDLPIPADEDRETLVARIGQGAMGQNTVENVLAVTAGLGELPEDTRVLTVEPGYDSWGMTAEEFTDPVEAALDDVLDRVLAHLEDAVDADAA